MYEKPRIISEPISNNRLNFHERYGDSIVVPSLIEGTMDDVILGEETVIESEVDGTIIAGKGLKHFVFLKGARVPTWIFDNHNHAFAFWYEALRKGWIELGGLLVHIDQHTDLATPIAFPSWPTPAESTEAIVDGYVNTNLTIADFIVPALSTGIISEALMVTGENRDGAGTFIWKNNSLLKKNQDSAPLIKGGRGDLLNSRSIIVDIDLDYFAQGFDEMKTLEIARYWIAKADIITIATSPLFIEQEKALAMLKSLQSVLLPL